MSVEYNRTLWEKLGAVEGLWAAILLSINLVLLLGAAAHPATNDESFFNALQGERMRWEWMTFLRIVAGLMIVWWMGSLAGRLRLAEGEPSRLASVSFGIGTLWGGVWLLSALFNSATILLSYGYHNPAGSRLAGALATETAYVLTPGLVIVLTFAVALVTLRFGGFPRWYALATLGVSGLLFVLALVDWGGSGNLYIPIMAISLLWMALTSVLLIPTYRGPERVGEVSVRS
jgi:uncharacterized membrane protein